jgi:hypothetical protein
MLLTIYPMSTVLCTHGHCLIASREPKPDLPAGQRLRLARRVLVYDLEVKGSSR